MRHLIATVVMILTSSALAQTTKPAAAKDAPGNDEYVVTKMRVQDFAPRKYFFITIETSYAEMATSIPPAVERLMASVKENNVSVKGPMLFVYHGAGMDAQKKFTVDLGFPVEDSTKDAGEGKVRQLEPFHAACVIYSGAVENIAQAYQQVFTDLFAAGLKPTEETREYYLYWESPESRNNVQLIQVGVK